MSDSEKNKTAVRRCFEEASQGNFDALRAILSPDYVVHPEGARGVEGLREMVETYRAALERRGVATDPWWERQLGLCLIGAMVQFGWEKALGGYDDELAWWEEQVLRAAHLLEAA